MGRVNRPQDAGSFLGESCDLFLTSDRSDLQESNSFAFDRLMLFGTAFTQAAAKAFHDSCSYHHLQEIQMAVFSTQNSGSQKSVEPNT